MVAAGEIAGSCGDLDGDQGCQGGSQQDKSGAVGHGVLLVDRVCFVAPISPNRCLPGFKQAKLNNVER